jgi:hypothetical protein
LLDWVLAIPIILHQTTKAILSTWFGVWLLRKLNRNQNFL